MPGLPALSIPAMTCGLGEESTPEAFIGHLILVMREMWRVLRDDGTCFVNLGDSYYGGKGASSQAWSTEHQDRDTIQKSYHQIAGKGQTRPTDLPSDTLKPKDLCLIPARFALAAQADGWWVRSDIIWAKPNPMPESVTDRPTKAHEYIWLMAKSQRYFYDAEAVKENDGGKNGARPYDERREGVVLGRATNPNGGLTKEWVAGSGRNRRTVWNIATHSYKGSHFATWPPKLVEPMILAGTSARGVCPECGSPWERVVEKELTGVDDERPNNGMPGRSGNGLTRKRAGDPLSTTTGWQPNCECPPADPIPATVLDPFNGSGTSGTVALDLGRAYIGVDISKEYVTELAEERIGGTQIGFGL